MNAAQQQYLAYLADKWPNLYSQFVPQDLTVFNGLGDSNNPATSNNWFTNLLNNVSNAIPALSQTYAQVQNARAQAELAELQRQTAIANASSGGGLASLSMGTWLMIGAAGVLGVVLLARK